MKKTAIICITLLLAFINVNAQNGELTTLRIGAFKYQMALQEASTLSEKPLKNAKGDYDQDVKIATYKGEEIELQYSYYDENTLPSDIKLHSLSTKSPLFKTKSGMGVGSTKEQLFKAYKDFPNFSVGQRGDGKSDQLSTTDSFFLLNDYQAGTILYFLLKNGIVTEVEVYMDEGC